MAAYRNVLALIVGMSVLQIAGGLLGVITPLGLQEMGLSAPMIGVIAALYAAGFMVGAATAARALQLFGNIRVYAAAGAASAAIALAMALDEQAWFWAISRLVHGAAFAWMFASVESWLSSDTPPERRGGVTGLYHVLSKAALMVGPFLAAGASALAPEPFLWCGIFMALSVVPVCLTRRDQPAPPSAVSLSIGRLLKLAPAAVYGAFLSGVINTGTTSLLPVYAQSIVRPDESATAVAAQVVAIAWIGGLVSQWPAGRLSDHVDRRLVVACMAIAAGVAALVVALGTGVVSRPVLLALIALWGAGSLSFYGISVAHGIDRSDVDEIPQVMSGLLFVWAVGSVIGPLLSGAAMRAGFGPAGLFLCAALISMGLALAMVVRRQARDPVPDADAEPWGIAQPTSVAASELDPRGPDPEPDPEQDPDQNLTSEAKTPHGNDEDPPSPPSGEQSPKPGPNPATG